MPESGDAFHHLLERAAKGQTFKKSNLYSTPYQYLYRELEQSLQVQFPGKDNYFYDVVLQSAWIKIWRKASQCQGNSSSEILAWARSIVYRNAKNLIRDDRKLEHMVSIENVLSEENEPAESSEEIEASSNMYGEKSFVLRQAEKDIISQEETLALLPQLTPQETKVYLMLKDGFSKKEIAEHMAISQPRVSQYVHQIRKKAGDEIEC